ncbi:MAG: uroporphyrinogen decarboxylase family protein [Candidatus Sumerlaeia bacterium]
MSTAKERVRSAMQHQQPDRVPFSWGFGPTREMQECLRTELAKQNLDWDRLRMASDDVIQVGVPYTGPAPEGGKDIWGVEREEVEYGGGSYNEISVCPLATITSCDEMNAFPWPDPDAYDYDALPRLIDEKLEQAGEEKAVRITAGNPLEIYTWMTGMEMTMMNLVADPDLARCGLDRVGDYWERRLKNIADAAGDRIDLLFFADDLGSQTGPLFSVDTYDSVVRPVHERLFSSAREWMPDAFRLFHSDGSAYAMLPSLIEAGIDCLEAVQVECANMEPDRLKNEFGDRLCFHGAISVQQLLPRVDAETVKSECRKLVEVLGKGGGYIAAPSHAVQMHTPVENVLAMLEAVLGEDDYHKALEAAKIG